MLDVQSLSAGYGALTVLRDISLQVHKGEAVAIVGANGAGKTTLVRALCGLIRAQGGRVVKDGVDLTSLPAHHRPRHGVASLLENRRLFGELSVRDNLRLAQDEGASSRRAHQKFGWDDICELFPMIREARGLLLQPDLLILDEPSTGLAPLVVRDILRVLRGLREGGLAILLVEQNVAIAVENADRAYVMSLGRIVHDVRGSEWRSFLDDGRLAQAYLGSTA